MYINAETLQCQATTLKETNVEFVRFQFDVLREEPPEAMVRLVLAAEQASHVQVCGSQQLFDLPLYSFRSTLRR